MLGWDDLTGDDQQDVAGRVATYVNTAGGGTYVTDCTAQAWDMVAVLIGANSVSDRILTRAVVETASELYHRREAPGGIVTAFEGTPIRMRRDPRDVAVAILAPYLGPVIA